MADPKANSPDTQQEIADECDALKALLLQKNLAYGDSAVSPVRVFSKASPVEQILVRLDDKLSRLARGDGSGNEDAILDILGYCILLRIAHKREAAAKLAVTPAPKVTIPSANSQLLMEGDKGVTDNKCIHSLCKRRVERPALHCPRCAVMDDAYRECSQCGS